MLVVQRNCTAMTARRQPFALQGGRSQFEVVDVVLLLLPPIELSERFSGGSLTGTVSPLILG